MQDDDDKFIQQQNYPSSDTYPLTHSQELIWLGQQINPDQPLYNMVFVFEFQQSIDYESFKQSFDLIVRENDGLRTLFSTTDPPQQWIANQIDHYFSLVEFDTEEDPETSSRKWIQQRKLKLINIDECCFDSHLLKLSEQHYLWYLNQHHLITDVWSSSLFYQLVCDRYHAIKNNQSGLLQTRPSISQYHRHEFENRNKHVPIAQRKSLDKTPVKLNFYGNEFQPDKGRSKRLAYSLSETEQQDLNCLAKQKSIATFSAPLTLFNIYLTTLCAYLHRVSNLSTVTIGIPIHNRTQQTHQQTIGLYVELFPITIEIDQGASFVDLYSTVREESQTLLQSAGPGLSAGNSASDFNVVLNYIHIRFDDQHTLADTIEWEHCDHSDPSHAIRLHVCQFKQDQTPEILFDINHRLWKQTGEADIGQHFTSLLNAFSQDPEQSLSKVSLCSSEDKNWLLEQYNQRPRPKVQQSLTVVDLFEQAVKTRADQTAVCDGDHHYSFAQIDHLSDQLCRQLVLAGVGKNQLVGIHCKRSIELIVSILAVLKNGSGYIPMDEHLAKAKIAYIAEQSGLKLTLTNKQLLPRLDELKVPAKIVDIEALSSANHDFSVTTAADISSTAYVIYTSGSTGKPKGVIVSHHALKAYIDWAIKHYTRGQSQSFALHSNIGFDLTVTSIFTPLCSGGLIRIYPNQGSSVDLSIVDVTEDNSVDIVKLTPAHLQLIDSPSLNKSKIKTFIVGGEDFKSALAMKIHARFCGQIKLLNEYGPTEATVGCMIHQFDAKTDQHHSVPIGKPADHARIYLLDEGLNPLPKGVTGEVFIAGSGLADGYLNQNELTQQAFVDDPFYAGEKMYKTGDLARRLNDEQLVYLSRKDDQYKINGVRIEKAEIEHALNLHPEISASHLRYLQANPTSNKTISYCQHCGIASNYPNLRFNQQGICQLCLDFETYRDKANQYFSDLSSLKALLNQRSAFKSGDYDCLMLFSGGKDSTYALYQLSQMNLSIYAMTLDNGFISDSAKHNITQTVEKLGIAHEFATTEVMNEIFVESLKKHCSVCYGCFKTIYTLALGIAKQRGIPTIVTGLSRGQFFETRLTKESFESHHFDPQQIDSEVLNARKVYHRVEDTVTQKLGSGLFDDDRIFEQISFIDFYRYCDVSLDAIYEFLDNEVPWIRPEDTGRSTNCLINDTGIYYHKQQQGYHNYALPYSWDVRLGLKTREQAMDELDDTINIRSVIDNLEKLGFADAQLLSDSDSLAIYYASEQKITTKALREFLSEHLNQSVIPQYFIHLEELPLTANGKIDHARLPDPRKKDQKEPTTLIKASGVYEKTLVGIFTEVLQQQHIGVADNYFDLGGDSIKAIQIAARATQFGFSLKPSQLFDYQTIEELATIISANEKIQISQSSVCGVAPLTPIQYWFFRQPHSALSLYNHSVQLELNEKLSLDQMRLIFDKLLNHHDALRHQYTIADTPGQQTVGEQIPNYTLKQINTELPPSQAQLDLTEMELHDDIDIQKGRLISVALISNTAHRKDHLIIVIHHIAVDAISWQIVLEDLDLLLSQSLKRQQLLLPLKTTAYIKWAECLNKYRDSNAHKKGLEQLPILKSYDPLISLSHSSSSRKAAIENYVCQLEAPLCESLTQLTVNGKRIALHKTLLAGLALSLGKIYSKPAVRINVESHGRYDLNEKIDITRTLGWFTSIHPICLTLQSNNTDSPLQKLIEQIDNQSDLSYHRFIESELSQQNEQPFYSNILFNYFGQHLSADYQQFSIERALKFVRSDTAQLQHALELNLFSVSNSVRIECSYHNDELGNEIVEQLMQAYRKELEHLCYWLDSESNQTDEFVIEDLSADDFAAIQRQLK